MNVEFQLLVHAINFRKVLAKFAALSSCSLSSLCHQFHRYFISIDCFRTATSEAGKLMIAQFALLFHHSDVCVPQSFFCFRMSCCYRDMECKIRQCLLTIELHMISEIWCRRMWDGVGLSESIFGKLSTYRDSEMSEERNNSNEIDSGMEYVMAMAVLHAWPHFFICLPYTHYCLIFQILSDSQW